MTRQEVSEKKIYLKQTIDCKDVLARYGVKIRGGRCVGFCHNGKDLNVKVFRDGIQCFVCGKRMDIFEIVQHFENCDFWTAFQILGGTDNIDNSTKEKIRLAAIKREQERLKEEKQKQTIAYINAKINEYRRLLSYCEPLSSEFAYCYKKWQYCLYLNEYFTSSK